MHESDHQQSAHIITLLFTHRATPRLLSSSFAEGSMQCRRKLYHHTLRSAEQCRTDMDQSDQPCILGVERQQQPMLYYLTVDDRLRQDITDSSEFFFSKCIGGVMRKIEVHRRGWKAGSRNHSRDVLYAAATTGIRWSARRAPLQRCPPIRAQSVATFERCLAPCSTCPHPVRRLRVSLRTQTTKVMREIYVKTH